MKHYKTISEYCRGIGISSPKHKNFDIRSFSENMGTIHSKMPPFRHEFYAIAIKSEGEGKAVSGGFLDFPESGSTIFFNTPFQIQSWDIKPNWEGYYLIFSKEFITKSKLLSELLKTFPFLKIDKAIPFKIPKYQQKGIFSIYENILIEYNKTEKDKFKIIEGWVYLLLSYIQRYFENQIDVKTVYKSLKNADLKLISRYQILIESSFSSQNSSSSSKLHSTKFYAEKLSVHPNYLNSVVKSVTGLTALNIIHRHIVSLAKSYLLQTGWSVKEIAYALHFENPNNFSSFFKYKIGKTPLAYRKNPNI